MNDINNIPDQLPAKISRECIEISSINFAGNIIPKPWFKSITYSSGKADMLAINILSEVIYWYRLVEECDEGTGKILGYRQKFREDMLQRNYQSFANMFGASRRQVKMAIDRLKDKELVKVEFRSIETSNNLILNNVMYIKPVPKNIKSITYPPSYIQMQEGVHSNVGGDAFECRTNTKNTNKIINNINYYDDNNIINKSKDNAKSPNLQESSSSSSFQDLKEKKNGNPEFEETHPYFFPPVSNETEAEILARDVMDYQISTGTKVLEKDRQRYLFTLIRRARNGTLIVPHGYRPQEERKKEDEQRLEKKKNQHTKEKAEQAQIKQERAEQEKILTSFRSLSKELQEEFIAPVKLEIGKAKAVKLVPPALIELRAAILYAKGDTG